MLTAWRIVIAYNQQMFSILNEIKVNSALRTTAVVTTSIGSAGFIYILVAITGYLSFGDKVSSNIIGMCKFSRKEWVLTQKLTEVTDIPSVASTIGKLAIVILVMFSYPLQVHPCRASVDAVLKWRPFKGRFAPPPVHGSPSRGTTLLLGNKNAGRPDTIGDTRFAAITTAIIILSYIVAMTVSSLATVLAYVGSTGSTSISFILPGLFYWKISSPDSPHVSKDTNIEEEEEEDQEESDGGEDQGLLGGSGLLNPGGWKKGLLRKLSLALAIYGIIVMVTCLVTNTFFIVAH
jgi:amino acid permease